MLSIIENKKIPFIVSSVLFVVSLILIFVLGLKLGIDFTGGSLIELSFTGERPSVVEVDESLSNLGIDLGSPVIQPTGDKGIIIRTQFLNEKDHQKVLTNLRDSFETEASIQEGIVENKVWEERIETIGPAISSQLRSRAIYAIMAVVIAIIVYVAYAFRKVSKPVQSWKYGISAIIALIHDITIVLGVFALLGYFLNIEIGIPFVVALLTILGYSVNDSIVVFDRVRENLIKRSADNFSEMVNLGVNQTILRSLNTSITTLVVLSALFLFGGESIKYFALALIVGIASGTYSSIFLASPLLVVWQELKNR